MDVIQVKNVSKNLFLIFFLVNGTRCFTPNGETALCISVYKCQTFQKFIQTKNKEQMRFWQESKCGYEAGPLVCCGTLDQYRKTPNITQMSYSHILNSCGIMVTKLSFVLNKYYSNIIQVLLKFSPQKNRKFFFIHQRFHIKEMIILIGKQDINLK